MGVHAINACTPSMPAATSFQSAVVHVPYPAHPQPKPAVASRHLLGHPNCNRLGRMCHGSLANRRLTAPVWHHSNQNLVAKVSDLNFISWCTECLTSFQWSGDSHTKMVGQKSTNKKRVSTWMMNLAPTCLQRRHTQAGVHNVRARSMS